MNKIKLSKSRYVAGCNCLKRLYLQVHQPGLAAQPTAADQAIMDQGHEVTVTVLWSANAWNATAGEAAQQVVADLFDLLARGGSVSVRVASSDGTERMLDVAVESR
jgi:hypothetical protein